MELGLINKKVVVTGGTRGIGRAIAEGFIAEGAEVLITGTKPRAGWWDDVSACQYFACDFAESDQVSGLQNLLKTLKVDILVNNAGIFSTAKIQETDPQVWQEMLQVNLTLPLLLMKTAAENMKENKWGRIVNVGSIAGIISREGLGMYSSTKAGLAGLTRAVALELAEHNVLVNCVCPAYTDTDMLKSLSEEDRNTLLQKVPLRRFGKPEDVARVVLFLASEANQFLTGQETVVDGAVTIQ